MPIGVLGGEFVAVFAVRLIGVLDSHTVTTANVLTFGYSLKVVGIYASRVVTQMINRESLRNSSDGQFVTDAMSWL
jgi:hypothetical protein